jgi:Uma2 family endonuclease
MTEQAPLSTSPAHYRLTVDDFFRLDEAGAFKGYGKTELIRGEVFYMNAQHRPHARMKGQLYLELVHALSKLETGLAVLIEATVSMPQHSAPEPDLILTSEPDGEGPVPIESVRLLIEISDTTHHSDLKVKAGLYAENGVPEYWVVDLKKKLIHRMFAPDADGYARRDKTKLGERIESATIAGLELVLPVLR